MTRKGYIPLLHPRTVSVALPDPATMGQTAVVSPCPEDIAAVLEAVGDAVVIFDRDFRFLYVNAEAEWQIGRPRSRLLGNAAWRLFPEEIAPYWEILQRAQNERVALTFTVEDPVDKRQTQGRCLPTAYRGDPRCLAVSYRRSPQRPEAKRFYAHEALQILSRVSDAFLSLDSRGHILFSNPQAGLLMNAECEDLDGRRFWELWPDFKGTRLEFECERSLRTRETASFELCLPSGRWMEAQIYPSPNDGLYLTLREITERKVREADEKRLLSEAIDRANRDPLTGLLNHRAFYERLGTEIARAERDNRTIALALLDVDHFKFFNEAFGHPVGDAVLKQIAKTLRTCCRSTDALGRLGGDEFALIVCGSAERDACELIAEIRARIEKEGFSPPGDLNHIPLGCSMGVAAFPHEAGSLDEMVALADRRLSSTKRGESRADASQFFADLRQRDEGFTLLDDLVTAVDNKDRYTRKHSEDVVVYSQIIAERLGLNQWERESLRIAALLHDVGKIGVPDSILRRPSPLSPSDYDLIKKHPTMGAAIIGAVPGMEAALPAVLYHHEAWDGSGYPHGIAGDAIPLEARILAVADGYSAMTTDRPYRKGMSPVEAQEILRQGAGTQWDARIVQILVSSPPPPA